MPNNFIPKDLTKSNSCNIITSAKTSKFKDAAKKYNSSNNLCDKAEAMRRIQSALSFCFGILVMGPIMKSFLKIGRLTDFFAISRSSIDPWK